MNFLGLDIAKATLAVCLLCNLGQRQSSFPNTAAGFEQLKLWLEQHLPLPSEPLHACMEATGNWGLDLAVFLITLGIKVSIVNPKRIKAYGESELLRNKTDALDAALIARFCRAQTPDPWTPLAEGLREFREMVRRCAALKTMRTQEINRSKAGFVSSVAAESIKRMIEFIESEIEQISKDIRKVVRASGAMQDNFNLLVSIPGVGEVTAAVLLAELPNIADFSPKALAAFAGISPQEKSSGVVKRNGKISRMGNAALRSALYMSALSARRHNPTMVKFADRLENAGKCKKAVLIAVARKTLVLAAAVIRSQKPFNAELVA